MNIEQVLNKAPGHIKLLADPVLYAKGAIESLTHQLKSVKSKNKKQRLEFKLATWQKALDVLNAKE